MDRPTNTFYNFGPFRIDAQKRLLLRGEEPISLAPKAFELLLVLVENRGRVLVKDDLMERIWPDQIVEDANITVNMSALRKALGENPHEHLYIVTVPGRGYRFVADVSESHNGDDLLSASGIAVEDNRQAQAAGESAAKVEKRFRARAASLLLRRKAMAMGILVVVLVAALFGIYRLITNNRETTNQSNPAEINSTPRSLAVLPFKQLRTSSSDDYLELGIADALITRLSNLSQITVRPTAQVLKYADSAHEITAVGRELGVDLILSGRVQQDGDRIRVTVQLIHAKQGHPVWAQQFDERFTDLFTVEDLISQQVAEALTLKLTADEQRRLAKHSTENSAAYVNYLKGRFYMLRYTPDGFNKSVLHFNQAIALDSNYALAYAGLADTYTATYGSPLSPRDSLLKAKEAALKALSIDDTLAEAHAALGHAKFHSFDWSGGQDLQRAIELNPNSVPALLWYGEYWLFLDPAKAVPILKRAQQLDPLSFFPTWFLSYTFMFLRQPDEAVMEAQKMIELDPNNPIAHGTLARVYAGQQNHRNALAELNKAKELGARPTGLAFSGYIYAAAGKRDEARQAIAELEQLARKQYVPLYAIAAAYVAQGEKDEAFQWLEKAYEIGDEMLPLLKNDPAMEPLRSDPCYADLLRRMGFAP